MVPFVSKVLVERRKNVLYSLISFNRTDYLSGRFIFEGGHLVSESLEITNNFNMKGLYERTIDIEIAFDSISHEYRLRL